MMEDNATLMDVVKRVWGNRPDLQKAFPDANLSIYDHHTTLLEWAKTCGYKESKPIKKFIDKKLKSGVKLEDIQ